MYVQYSYVHLFFGAIHNEAFILLPFFLGEAETTRP